MIVRIVQMTFHPEQVEAFLELFEATKHQIRNFEGCKHLELWQDPRYPNIMMTYSHWESEEALEKYRQSALFKSTWKTTKNMFAAPPKAWSMKQKSSA